MKAIIKVRNLAVVALLLPYGAVAAPPLSVSFKAPSEGGVMSGVYQDSSGCEVTGTNINRVEFFLGTTKLNTELNSPWHCSFDSRTFAPGQYALKAVAYDKKGRSTSAQVNVAIENNNPPSVGFTAPAVGETLSGLVDGTRCAASASDSDGSVAKVDFYVDSTLVTTKSTTPYECAFDSAEFPNGTHVLMAVATDNQGASASTQRSVNLQNDNAPPPPSAKPIDPADIIGKASAEVLFAEQSGYTAQVIGTYTSASSIAETGIHGNLLSNGETLRFGKETDPLNSLNRALAFQVDPKDPSTSGGKRAELSFVPNIATDEVYWVALSVFVHDWGTLASGDVAIFGTQMHSGDNSRGLSPSFSLVTTNSGRNFKVDARYSTSSSPSQDNDVAMNLADRPIPFGRWTDFVFKFKHNTSGSGLLQVWMDGNQIVDYAGNLGYNTPGYKDYAKFGYYNWTSAFSSTRKVLLRAPTVVADPTGKYSADDLRAHIQPAP